MIRNTHYNLIDTLMHANLGLWHRLGAIFAKAIEPETYAQEEFFRLVAKNDIAKQPVASIYWDAFSFAHQKKYFSPVSEGDDLMPEEKEAIRSVNKIRAIKCIFDRQGRTNLKGAKDRADRWQEENL